MGHEEDTILSLSLGSCVPPTTRTRNPQNPISLDASLALSVSDDTVDMPATTPKAPPSSSHSTASTLISTPCRVKREKDHEYTARGGEEAEVLERGSSSRASDEDDDGSVRKKLRLTKEQSALLEERFKEHSTLNPKQKQALAKRLNLRQRQVEVWFQNRRARTKLKQTEADCELLKRCWERLTDENRRLQKEVNELRATKYVTAPPPLYMQLPAANLTVCPSCERVTGAEVVDAGAKGGGGGGTGPFGVGAPKSHFFNPFTRSAAC